MGYRMYPFAAYLRAAPAKGLRARPAARHAEIADRRGHAARVPDSGVESPYGGPREGKTA